MTDFTFSSMDVAMFFLFFFCAIESTQDVNEILLYYEVSWGTQHVLPLFIISLLNSECSLVWYVTHDHNVGLF